MKQWGENYANPCCKCMQTFFTSWHRQIHEFTIHSYILTYGQGKEYAEVLNLYLTGQVPDDVTHSPSTWTTLLAREPSLTIPRRLWISTRTRKGLLSENSLYSSSKPAKISIKVLRIWRKTKIQPTGMVFQKLVPSLTLDTDTYGLERIEPSHSGPDFASSPT